MGTQLQRAETLKALHEREGAFVIPNLWDIGSARRLATLGFEALARAAATATARAAIQMRDHGSFAWIADVLPGSEVEKLVTRE